MTHTSFRALHARDLLGKTDVMVTFTLFFSGVKGRALFSLLFMASLVVAADTATANDGETHRHRRSPCAVRRGHKRLSAA